MLYLFDLPLFDGHDLRAVPLEAPRALLQAVLAAAVSERVRFSEAFEGAPHDVLQAACRLGLEGVIAKRRDSAYRSRRSADWLKLKCQQRQDFVIGDCTEPQGARVGLGALMLGLRDAAGALVYAGKVGTGFDQATLVALKTRLEALHSPTQPFSQGNVGSATFLEPPRGAGGAQARPWGRSAAPAVAGRPHWVAPLLVAQVSARCRKRRSWCARCLRTSASLKGGDHWTVRTVHTRLDRGNDAWMHYGRGARGLGAAMKLIGYTGEAGGG